MQIIKKEPDIHELFEREIAHFPPAKRDLFRFVRFAEENKDWVFIFPGSEAGTHKHLRNMRTNLSKLRAEIVAKNKGSKMKQFKMNIKSITFDPSINRTTIILVKVREDKQKFSEGLSTVLDEMLLEPQQ